MGCLVGVPGRCLTAVDARVFSVSSAVFRETKREKGVVLYVSLLYSWYICWDECDTSRHARAV